MKPSLVLAGLITGGALTVGVADAKAGVTIDAVYFAQTHAKKSTESYFGLVGNRNTLIKAHVVSPETPAAPAVTALLTLGAQSTNLTLTGPAVLPASIPDGLGVVQHAYSNSFTAVIPKAWVKAGLTVTVSAGTNQVAITNLLIGAPTKLIMNMFDVQYFSDTSGDYPAGWQAEIEAKWPMAEMEVRRVPHVVFPELVVPPRAGVAAARVRSPADYTIQTGLGFDGEQAAALEWKSALKAAAGKGGRISYYYVNIYGVNAGGQAGGFGGVGNGTSLGIFHHESGHALSLPHWGDSAAYPYKGDMYGIAAPDNYNATHAGPTWAFDLRTLSFIPCTAQSNNVSGHPAGTYKVDPMQGGGTGWQEPGYLLNHFSDYSANQARNYLEGHVLIWNTNLNQYASWNQTAKGYTSTVANNGVDYPVVRDTSVISIMASISGANTNVNMVYPPIGPYTTGLIKLFDPTVASNRIEAASIFAPAGGCDVCVRVTQGGVQKTYMLAASWDATADPLATGSLQTKAINVPASNGVVTKVELLLTPDSQINGLPANPQVLYTWPANLIGAPTGLTAIGSNGIVRLAWSPPTGSATGYAPTGYQVKRSLASGGPYTTILSLSGTNCNDTQVTNGVTYYYVVSPTNSLGEGAHSVAVGATPGTNAKLVSLVPSVGSLSPAFASSNFSYTAAVSYATTTSTVTPTSMTPGVTITVNGNIVASGTPSGPISLAVGTNLISTVVTASDIGATNIYLLLVTRAVATASADLLGLATSAGSLAPSFASGIFSYSVIVPDNTTSLTVTPTAVAGATIRLNGYPVSSGSPSVPIGLAVGANQITVTVVSQDTTVTNLYRLTVLRGTTIAVVNTATYTFNNNTLTSHVLSSNYNVAGVDKLVMTVAGENKNPGGVGTIGSVTYNGTPFMLAIKRDNTSAGYQEAAVGIYYLDNPSQYGTSGNIVANTPAAWNSCGASILSLVGTAPGLDATNSGLAAVTSLTTVAADTLVLAATENGLGNGATQPAAQSPLTGVLSYRHPSGYTGSASGYQRGAGPGATVTHAFSNDTSSPTTLAVSFAAAAPSLSAPVIFVAGPRTGTSFPLSFGGPAGQTYKVLFSTNMAMPLSNWTTLTSGTFGASAVIYTHTGATNACQFYVIESP